jgi:phospholipase/carboxylesterase
LSEEKSQIKRLSGPAVSAKSGEVKQLMVLFHGYGSDGNDMISLSSYWADILPNTMFIAPNAPEPCDINPMGFQWFALDTSASLDLEKTLSRLTGSKAARPNIEHFLKSLWEETGMSAKDTILVGFSQGAMMALEVGLRLDEQLRGVIAFSGGLVDPKNIAKEIKSKPPVCFVHGGNDDVVPVGMSVVSSQALEEAGLDVKLHISPPAGHTIAIDGLEFASEFIKGLSD